MSSLEKESSCVGIEVEFNIQEVTVCDWFVVAFYFGYSAFFGFRRLAIGRFGEGCHSRVSGAS